MIHFSNHFHKLSFKLGFFQSKKIFEKNEGREDVIYIVSDNTGNSNGGSDELMKNAMGKRIKNTKGGTFEINNSSFDISPKGCYWI